MCVGEVKVVGEVGVLTGYSGYAFHAGKDAALFAMASNLKVLLFETSSLGFEDEACNLEVTEACLLDFQQEGIGKVFKRILGFELVLEIHNVLHSRDEPWVDLCQLLYALDSVALLQRFGNGKDT